MACCRGCYSKAVWPVKADIAIPQIYKSNSAHAWPGLLASHSQLLSPQAPAFVSILNHWRPVRPAHPIQTSHRQSIPQFPHLRNRPHRLADPPNRLQRRSPAPMQTLHFPRRDLIAISVVAFHIARAQRPIMQPVSADQRVHRIQPRVPEKSHPQLEVALRPVLRAQPSPRALP